MLIQASLQSGSLSVRRSTRVLGVSRSGFYDWRKCQVNGPSSTDQEMTLRSDIQQIALEFPRYGYRRITWELRHRGYTVNHKRVLRLMRADNLLCLRKTFIPQTTDSRHTLRTYPNLVGELKVTKLNQVWASDITYIRLPREFVYLSVILDLCSRRCIGWALSRHIDTQLTLTALDRALEARWTEDVQDLIHHSDRGVQYAANDYIERLEVHGIRISMGRKGNPYDNAFVESFNKTLKCEEVYLNEYETFLDALENIGRFIEQVYNKKRLHSSLGYQSPIQFEQEVGL